MNLLKLTKGDWLECLVLLMVYTGFYIITFMFFQESVFFIEYFQGFTMFFMYALGKASMIGKAS